jgi:hypothetical protein
VDSVRKGANDPERLLPGEASDSVSYEDARHWASVYREMLRFKEQLLASFKVEGVGLEASLLRATELGPLQAQRERLRRRLAFWEGREHDLSPV